LQYYVLLRKEIKENIRTYKFLIMVAILLVFGIGTPLMIKFLPEILKLSGEQIPLTLPVLGATDALQSYISNLSQVGLLLVVLISMGAVAQERERRTAVMVLSKSAGPGAFILAKMTAIGTMIIAGLLLGAIGFYFYTTILLGPVDLLKFTIINLLSAYYLLFCLSITLMFSSLVKSQLAAGGLSLVTLIGLAAISNIPFMSEFVPSALMGWATSFINGGNGDSVPAMMICGVLIILSLLAGWQILRRTEI